MIKPIRFSKPYWFKFNYVVVIAKNVTINFGKVQNFGKVCFQANLYRCLNPMRVEIVHVFNFITHNTPPFLNFTL
jgi:hypothetical protein